MCNLFYIGHLLGDKYCSYMLEAIIRSEQIIAFNIETMNNYMAKIFMSLLPDDYKTYAIPFPQDIKNNYRNFDNFISNSNALLSDYGSFEWKMNAIGDFQISIAKDYNKKIRMKKMKLPLSKEKIKLISSIRCWDDN